MKNVKRQALFTSTKHNKGLVAVIIGSFSATFFLIGLLLGLFTSKKEVDRLNKVNKEQEDIIVDTGLRMAKYIKTDNRALNKTHNKESGYDASTTEILK